MARGTGTVTVKFLGDTDHLEKAFGKVNNGLGKVGSGFATMGKAAAVGIGAAAAVAIPFGIKAVQMASDVEESLSKVNAVFGQSGAEIDKWAKGAATSIGLSRGEALDAAGTFGNMFRQLNIGAPEAAKMSKQIVGLAADFASFHNADISEVISAQSAAFRGEYDALQRFLPLINAATVEQRALAMTGKKTTKELTAQEKALAVNALMAEGAGKAVGDFARTSGGLANQMRILKARGEDFAANVGSVLLPIVLRGLDLFTEWAGKLKDLVGPAIESLTPRLQEIAGQFVVFRDTAEDVIDKIVGFVGGFVDSFRSAGDDVGTTAGKLTQIVGQVKEVFSSAFGAIRAVVVAAVDFLKGIWRVFGDDLTRFAREAWAGILEVVRGALNVLTGIFDLIKAVFTGKWGDAWTAVKKILDGAWDGIFGLIRNAVTNVIPTIIAGLGQVVTSAARTAFDGLKDIFRGAINWIIDRWNGLEFKAPAVDTPFGKVGGFTIGVPDMPRLARGGTFDGAALVGERGPELLVGAGRVVPNNQLGATTVNITVNGAVDKAGTAREIEEILYSFVRAGGNLRFT
jgi:hypothetical protein